MQDKKGIIIGIMFVVLLLIGIGFVIYWPFRSVEEKIADFYNNRPNIYLDEGIETKWEQMLTQEPNAIVQSEFSIMNPKYAFVYAISNEEGDILGYDIHTFYFKRENLIEFEIDERFRTDVSGQNLTFDQVVELADSRNVRDMSEEDLMAIENVKYATRYNNPTPEQQAQDEEWRTPQLSWEWESPDGSDAMEIWETRNYSLGYIKIQSTGEILFKENEVGPWVESYKPNNWIDWIDDDHIIYATTSNCLDRNVGDPFGRPIKEEKFNPDDIYIYDIKTNEHKVVLSYNDDSNCYLNALTAVKGYLLITTMNGIDYYDKDANFIKTIPYTGEVRQKLSEYEQVSSFNYTTWIEYEDGILTLGFNEFHEEEDLVTMEIE